MVPLSDFKEKLGQAGKDLPDLKIEALREMQYKLADIFFDAWLRRKPVIPNPTLKTEAFPDIIKQ